MVRLTVLSDIDRGAAILAADRHALQDAQQNERYRADAHQLLVVRQQADGEGRSAHDHHGCEERAFAAKAITEPAEDQRAQRPEQQARRKHRQRGQRRIGLADLGRIEELVGEQLGQRAIDKEVVPLERRPG